jgi:hypothetical protein
MLNRSSKIKTIIINNKKKEKKKKKKKNSNLHTKQTKEILKH